MTEIGKHFRNHLETGSVNNTGKKHTVVRDELGVNGGGIYCFMPFSRLDENGKAIFKVGMAINFNHRLENYHTYFPLGVYMVAFLENPLLKINTRNTKAKTKKAFYMEIEKYILNMLDDRRDVYRIHSTTRTRNQDEMNKGESEWFYCDENVIINAFQEAQKKYGGNIQVFHLNNINEEADKAEKRKNKYVAEIIYPISNRV